MILFRKSLDPIWVNGSLSIFNQTEIGDYSFRERYAVQFLVAPISSMDIRDLIKKNTESIMIDELEAEFLKNESVFKNKQTWLEVKRIFLTAGLGVREVFHRERYNEDIFDACIKDWKIQDQENMQIPCTRENKLALFVNGSYTQLGSSLVDLSLSIVAKYDKVEKELEKNLLTSQDGQVEEITK